MTGFTIKIAEANLKGGRPGHRQLVHGKNWSQRRHGIAAILNNMNVDLIVATEMASGNEDTTFDSILGGQWKDYDGLSGNHTLYYKKNIYQAVSRKSYRSRNKSFTKWTMKHIASGNTFYILGCHYQAFAGFEGVRRANARDSVAAMKSTPTGVIIGDLNTISKGSGGPRDILEKGGWDYLTLKQRGFGIADQILTRNDAKVTNIKQVSTQHLSDHSYFVSATITWGTPSSNPDDPTPDDPATPVPPPYTTIPPGTNLDDPPYVPPVVPHDPPAPTPWPGSPPSITASPGAPPGLSRLDGSQGYFRVMVKHPNGRAIDITMFRDVPIQVGDYSSTDPFGDASAVLNFPQITVFDRPGSGDLWWLVPWASVDISWWEVFEDGPAQSDWVWEGFIVSEEVGDSYSVQCKGALYQIDNYLAAPFYPRFPVPYEKLITMAMDPLTHAGLKTNACQIEYPEGWNTVVPPFTAPDYLWFLQPWGVAAGEKWSGLTSRATGAWDAGLTGFVQGLLANMYTNDGDQWTIEKLSGRQPVLKVRESMRAPDENTLVIYNGVPGVTVSASRDFTQSSNVIYGQGTDLAKSSFSGAQVTADGQRTYYEPFAALPQVHPVKSNPRFLPSMIRKESRLTFTEGLDEIAARDVAVTQIRRFADPGYTGSINLDVDPTQNDSPFNRLLIKAGRSILLKNFRGTEVLFHISTVSVSPETGTVTLTVDSKYRDALTVQEVRARTRDALDPTHALGVGRASNIVPDMLLPWSYASGSGVVPSGSELDATKFFKSLPLNEPFPWITQAHKYPPKDYPKYYIKVSKKGVKADHRWQDFQYSATSPRSLAVPIRMAQQGSIRLSQFAAYDKYGVPVKVRFHVGIYDNNGTSSTSMPAIPAGTLNQPYAAADHYPFFPGAFDNAKPDGSEQNNPGVLLPDGTQLIVGWGTSFEPAGYSPGTKTTGAKKSGMLVDESDWSFDTSGIGGFDKYVPANNAKNPLAGLLYVMIYCDDLDEVYFIGRLFKKEEGQ